MDYKSHKSWHIPRASLSSGSNSGQSSTDSVRNFDRRQSDVAKHPRYHRKTSKGDLLSLPASTSSSASSIDPRKPPNRLDREKQLGKNLEKLHRGSRSSQGSSTDGISSLHSASSLLLSVANLELFARMQDNSKNSIQPSPEWSESEPPSHLVLNMIGENAIQPKAKDFDQLSIASSTHFTVVNGFGRSSVRPKSNSVCRQGRQITILIVTMSFLFMVGILGMIYLMDRRARAMPAFHQ